MLTCIELLASLMSYLPGLLSSHGVEVHYPIFSQAHRRRDASSTLPSRYRFYSNHHRATARSPLLIVAGTNTI
jgi:hypothetical protein